MDKETLAAYKKAGEILAESIAYGKKMIKPGTKMIDICDAVEAKILSMGGGLAFPAQISKNDIAAHYCPGARDETTCDEGDLLKLDCGVHIDGFIADTAVTVNLGSYDELVKASEEALKAALKVVGVGVRVSDIGKSIQEVIESYGFAPVKNLSGHGLSEFTVHDYPSIPNFETGSNIELEEGMVVAVEPFASNGAGMIYESSNPTIFSMNIEKPVRSPTARKIMKDIISYEGLPFTTRWLTKKHPEGMARIALNEMVRNDILEAHPPLIDKANGFVSQAEHTVIIQDKPIITTKI